ncbi:hypothetical protein [Kineosporia sp. NBRC 101731]|uniref:hypothetical protein n=1 Tax=Kineosporia sp. NBRC 101731 TaxID=3032199 RepID=UPI0024A15039|nr:hypothetical protein [Kineosporia sp. NBRC 101731]GLY30759.1 hypothetical protein Kisp02_41240 [Kineosporia sp. NBRC 101731]
MPGTSAATVEQLAAFTVLVNEHNLLPITDRPTLYVDGLDPALAARYGTVVAAPTQAQVALVRLKYRTGDDLAAHELDRITDIAETTTTVVDISLERPALLSPMISEVKALLVSSDMNDEIFLDAVFGRRDLLGL